MVTVPANIVIEIPDSAFNTQVPEAVLDRITDVELETQSLGNELGNVNETLSNFQDSVSEDFNNVNARVDGVEAALHELADDLDNRVTALENTTPPSPSPTPAQVKAAISPFDHPTKPAVGNGVADDTDAVKWCLDKMWMEKRATRGAGAKFAIFRPIVITVTAQTQGNVRFDGENCEFISKITNGGTVLTIDAREPLRGFGIERVTFDGTGTDGNGLMLYCDNADPGNEWLWGFDLDRVDALGFGKNGLHLMGSVFEGVISRCRFEDNNNNGVEVSNLGNASARGVVSALAFNSLKCSWNGKHGFETNNWSDPATPSTSFSAAPDISINDAYFGHNDGAAIRLKAGNNRGVWLSNIRGENNWHQYDTIDAAVAAGQTQLGHVHADIMCHINGIASGSQDGGAKFALSLMMVNDSTLINAQCASRGPNAGKTKVFALRSGTSATAKLNVLGSPGAFEGNASNVVVIG